MFSTTIEVTVTDVNEELIWSLINLLGLLTQYGTWCWCQHKYLYPYLWIFLSRHY